MPYKYLAKPTTIRTTDNGRRQWGTVWIVEYLTMLRTGEPVFQGTEAQARAVADTLNRVRA